MRIIVTGGSGLLARYIIEELKNDNGFQIDAIVSGGRVDFAKRLYQEYENVDVISRELFFTAGCQKEHIRDSIIIHTAFTRENNGIEVAKSLDYAYALLRSCKKNNAAGVINISSRSVYQEPAEGTLNKEDSLINTDSLIATAKYGTELLTRAFLDGTDIKYTNLRIASVNELKLDNNMVRPLNVFVDCVIKGEAIKVINGNQIMSFVDPRDVAKAVSLICESNKMWKNTYNIGAGDLCTGKLIDMAKRVVEIGEELGYKRVEIGVIKRDINQTAGLNIDRISKDFNYRPVISLDDMVKSLFQMKGAQG